MVEGKRKSRSLKRTQTTTPGGKNVIHYRSKKPSKALCAVCKKELHGLQRKSISKQKNLPKSQKTVSRPYGSNLCSACMRDKIKKSI